jgi:hypothetical protein
MTPPRLNQLKCPACQRTSWIIDSDFRGMGEDIPYSERPYLCRGCTRTGSGWTLLQQSPPAFLLQPSTLYPMTRDEFDHWVAILRDHFPDHSRLSQLDDTFVPCTPEEARAEEEAFNLEHPVALMRDQDGARRANPSARDAMDWLDMMKPGDSLSFERRDGGRLVVERREQTCSVAYLDPATRTAVAEAVLSDARVRAAVKRYLWGEVERVIK